MPDRKSKSLYGRQIREALRKDQLPQLRSEELPSFRRYFVDLQLLEQIHNNTNQLIVGRRGTGKTHLLGTFNEMIRDDEPTELSIMISILEVAPRSRFIASMADAETSVRKIAVALFESFLHVFLDKFIVEVERRLKVLRGSLAFSRESDARVNRLMEQLLEAIELGTLFTTSKTSSTSKTETNEKSTRSGGNIEFGIADYKPKAAFNAGASGEKKNGLSQTTKTEIESQLAVDTYQVQSLLTSILNELHVDTLFLLIDEWMELDKKAMSGIQPIFAQLLKATFVKEGRVAIKIASIWHQTNLYDRDEMTVSQGMELRHDINQACDLDMQFMTKPEEARAFCKGILFKRLASVCPALLGLENDAGEIDDLFITELFDNDDNFRAFIAASHGIPRDIMLIFHRCSLRIKRDFEHQCINHEQIFDVAKRSYMADKRKSIDATSAPQKLLSEINKYLERTGRRIFIVDNHEALRSSALRKLVDEELIHQIPSAVAPRCIQETHKCFLIDFGNFVDWVRARRQDLSRLLTESLLPQFPDDIEENWASYVIDVGAADETFIRCPSCQKNVPAVHPVLLRFKCCPHCAKQIDLDASART